MAFCFLGLGANLGERELNIRLALEKIGQLAGTSVVKVSSLFETLPVGGPAGQRRFLNGAAKIETTLSPRMLLRELKKIERALGRTAGVHHGPRVIDLDILLYDDRIIKSRDLEIPHPAMFERDFVMRPLAEIL